MNIPRSPSDAHWPEDPLRGAVWSPAERDAWQKSRELLFERAAREPRADPKQELVSFLILRPSEAITGPEDAPRIRSGSITFKPVSYGIGFNHRDMFWDRHLLFGSRAVESFPEGLGGAPELFGDATDSFGPEDVVVMSEFPGLSDPWVALVSHGPPVPLGVHWIQLLIDWSVG